jgi:hypothetical protein
MDSSLLGSAKPILSKTAGANSLIIISYADMSITDNNLRRWPCSFSDLLAL